MLIMHAYAYRFLRPHENSESALQSGFFGSDGFGEFVQKTETGYF